MVLKISIFICQILLGCQRDEEWKQSRKMLNPAFTTSMLSNYMEVINKNASNLVKNLKLVADTGKEVDVIHYALNVNLDTIVENTMGVSIASSEKFKEEFYNATLEGVRGISKRVLFPWLRFHFTYMLYLKITGKHESINRQQYFASKILKNHLNKIHNQNIQQDSVNSPRTVIDLVLKNNINKNPGLTEIRIRTELLQIILAGTEPPALNLSFLMVMLAIHQDVQQKVYEEIVQLTRGDDTITVDQSLHQLKYLEQCIRETLRLFAPGALTSRRTRKECLLKGNTIIPANMIVLGIIHFTNRHPELFKNPDKWDPERFSEEAIAKLPKGITQLSFGFGPRSCIGGKYTMMSVKTQIAQILLNYHLSTHLKEITKDNLKIDFMIKSKIGYPVKFTSREKVEL